MVTMRKFSVIVLNHIILIVILITTVFKTTIFAKFEWEMVNMQGMGYITGMAISPVYPYDIYIRPDVSGPYRYDREKQEWIPLFDWYNHPVSTESIAVHPTDPNTAYAVVDSAYATAKSNIWTTEDDIYLYGGDVAVTNDRGKTWKFTGLSKEQRAIYINGNSGYRSWTGERLAVDPNNTQILYFASARDGFWKKDGDLDWQKDNNLPVLSNHPDFLNNDGNINQDFPGYTFTVTYNENNKTIVYVGVWSEGVYKSTDAGKTFAKITNSYKYPGRACVASDGTLYISGGSYIGADREGKLEKITMDGIVTDITPKDAKKTKPIHAISVSPSNSNLIITGQDDNVWKSDDGGKNYDKINIAQQNSNLIDNSLGLLDGAPKYYLYNDAISGIANVLFDYANSNQAWYMNGWGVAKTENINDITVKWKYQMKKLEELCARVVKVPNKTKDKNAADLWFATCDVLGFVVDDKTVVPQKTISPKNLDKLGNLPWTTGKFPNPIDTMSGLSGIDICYSQPNYGVAVGTHQWITQAETGEYTPIHGKTTDGGRTWEAFSAIPEAYYYDWSGKPVINRANGGKIAISPKEPDVLVWAPCGYKMRLHYSNDGGKTWNRSKLSNPPAKPADYNQYNPEHYNYDSPPYNWGQSISPWVTTNCLTADIADPTGQTFYYSDNFSVWYSNDGGKKWTERTEENKKMVPFPGWSLCVDLVSNPLKKGDIWLAFPRNHQNIKCNPLYRSQDEGLNFYKVESVSSAERIAFGKGNDEQTPAIYILGKINNDMNNKMYKSNDMGKTWIPLSDDKENIFLKTTDIEGDMNQENLLYYTTNGNGVGYGYSEFQPERSEDFLPIVNISKNQTFKIQHYSGMDQIIPSIVGNGGQCFFLKKENSYCKLNFESKRTVTKINFNWENSIYGRLPQKSISIFAKNAYNEYQLLKKVTEEEITKFINDSNNNSTVSFDVTFNDIIFTDEIKIEIDGRYLDQFGNEISKPQVRLNRLEAFGYLMEDCTFFNAVSLETKQNQAVRLNITKKDTLNQEGELIIAGYDDNNRLCAIYTEVINSDYNNNHIDLKNNFQLNGSTKAKVFLWGNLNGVQPLGRVLHSDYLKIIQRTN